MEVSVHLHASATLPLKKKLSFSIEQEAGWAPESVWTLWSKQKSLAPAGNRTPSHRWENSVKMGLKNRLRIYRRDSTGSEMIQWRELVNAVTNFRAP
jgi:hypothetical protein